MTTALIATTRRTPLVRTALVPCLVVGTAAAMVAWTTTGSAGLLGAAVGTVLVVGFFGLGQLILTVCRDVSPPLLFVVALMSYLLQVVALLAVFAAFQRHPEWSDHASPRVVGLTLLACTLVWTSGLVLAARQERIPLYDLGGGHG